ncbi:MAG: YeeE/YedE family protein [Chloroflexia bacterium]|nr:YeeE/YedE family protein [Chloroflexia bacterium]
MLHRLRNNPRLQLLLGLLLGVAFGFLLQKSGICTYDVILGQLLLEDFTVVKVMFSAVITGMLGVYLMRSLGWVRLIPKSGSLGSSVVGGLIFGVSFAILGYCPGTLAGAVGQGALDALVGGLGGIVLGAGLFAVLYPRLQKPVLNKGNLGTTTLPELLQVNPWAVVLPAAALLGLLLWALEVAGL